MAKQAGTKRHTNCTGQVNTTKSQSMEPRLDAIQKFCVVQLAGRPGVELLTAYYTIDA